MHQDIPAIQRNYQKMSSREIGYKIGKNISFVPENSLCTGCATCEAVCPEDAIAIRYRSDKGIHEPVVDDSKCTDCELCVMTCPGFELDLYDRPDSQKNIAYHDLIGPYTGIWQAYTHNSQIRQTGASGGIITQLLVYLFNKQLIDGAIVTRMHPDAPLETLTYIAKSPEELAPSQKSKYCPTPLNSILKPIIRNESPYQKLAYVGLPSHIHGLRLLQRLYPELKQKIPYVISPFTAHVSSRHATEFLLYVNQINIDEVEEIQYRGGGVPGRLSAKLKDGSYRYVPHLDWSYYGHTFSTFFYPPREWLYFDKLSEWADFSMGDNWRKGFSEQQGLSTTVARSHKAAAIVQDMIREQVIHATPMSTDDLVRDQTLVNKKNIGIRLKVWKLLGRKVPIYTHYLPVRWRDFLRTLRFAIYVQMCERNPSYSFLKRFIYADYLLRKVLPKKVGRKIRSYWSLLGRLLNIFWIEPKVKTQDQKCFPKVILIGGFGWHDIGDESMPHAVRLEFRRKFGRHLNLMMFSPDPEYTTQLHGESSVLDIKRIGLLPSRSRSQRIKLLVATLIFLMGVIARRLGIRLKLWQSARYALDELCEADVLFNVGGGNLNSIIPQELYKKCTTYLAARILGKPIIISGQTLGPFTNSMDRWYAQFCLNKVHMITFRDKAISHQRATEIGIAKPIMLDAADDAMTIPSISRADAIALLEKETQQSWDKLSAAPLRIFLNLKGSLKVFKGQGRQANLDNEIGLMAKIADALVEELNATVIFLPTDFCGGVDDRPLHVAVMEKMYTSGSAQVFSVQNEYTDSELKGMLSVGDFAIGARYHFNVFAASVLVPFLGIASGDYQRTKLKGLADLCNLPECFVEQDMEFADFESTWLQVLQLIHSRYEIRQQLAKVVPALEQRSLLGVQEAIRLLEQAGYRV